MIQLIANNILDYDDKIYKKSRLNEFDSFDDYSINVIDLSNESIWRCNNTTLNTLNCISDLNSLAKEIQLTKKAKIIIVFPQNVNIYYSWYTYSKKYSNSKKVKDVMDFVIRIISNSLIKIDTLNISYSKSKTEIGKFEYKSDFNFNVEPKKNMILTYSKSSNKITTIFQNNVFYTTLNIFETVNHFENFLLLVKNDKGIEEQPLWIKDVKFFNDDELIKEKNTNIEEINRISEQNKIIDIELEKNNVFKSILFSNGDYLVRVVLKIMDDILDYNSSSFKDEKREDFVIKKESITFVGEIKGYNRSAENKDVSQLDNHVQGYIDKLLEEERTENVKGLLIINPQKNINIFDRNEVHSYQIELAKRNGALIIETKTLLKLYENYLLKKIDRKTILEILTNKIGLLVIEDFYMNGGNK